MDINEALEQLDKLVWCTGVYRSDDAELDLSALERVRTYIKDTSTPPRGQWKRTPYHLYECSVCHFNEADAEYNYCPNCGANMEDGIELKHNVVKVKDLMYKGCEYHWGCKRCGMVAPFHCYKFEQFAEMKCRPEDIKRWRVKENRTW